MLGLKTSGSKAKSSQLLREKLSAAGYSTRCRRPEVISLSTAGTAAETKGLRRRKGMDTAGCAGETALESEIKAFIEVHLHVLPRIRDVINLKIMM